MPPTPRESGPDGPVGHSSPRPWADPCAPPRGPPRHSSRVAGTEEQQRGEDVTGSGPHGCTAVRTQTHIPLRAEIRNILSGGLSCPLRATLFCRTERTGILALVSNTAPLLMGEQKGRPADAPALPRGGPLRPFRDHCHSAGPRPQREAFLLHHRGSPGSGPVPPADLCPRLRTAEHHSRAPRPAKPSRSPGRCRSHADLV